MAAPSVFTIEAANALIPRLQGLMEAQMGRRGEIEKLLERLSQRLGKTPEAIQDDPADPDDVRDLKRDIIGRVERYHAAWSELEEMGAVLKDPRTGLVDFYGRVDGKLVWLCWKYGETQVTHYHGLDEGFSGRKPIEQTMRTRHLN